jgi:hypothetical protein
MGLLAKRSITTDVQNTGRPYSGITYPPGKAAQLKQRS